MLWLERLADRASGLQTCVKGGGGLPLPDAAVTEQPLLRDMGRWGPALLQSVPGPPLPPPPHGKEEEVPSQSPSLSMFPEEQGLP